MDGNHSPGERISEKGKAFGRRHGVAMLRMDARQYCGQLGKQDNCQVAVSLSLANDHASLPAAYTMYLPDSWAKDMERRAKAGVPEDIVFLSLIHI